MSKYKAKYMYNLKTTKQNGHLSRPTLYPLLQFSSDTHFSVPLTNSATHWCNRDFAASLESASETDLLQTCVDNKIMLFSMTNSTDG